MLKLFVWDGRKHYLASFLQSYANGVAFALAYSKEQAIELLVTEKSRYVTVTREELALFEPEVFEGPVGFSIFGGD